ncbi:MAG: polysaccharide biosynthesis protein [Clostridia bacterium]|nr:polysaccharide biosynthesis protein [Clostridia bacterium]
MARKKQNYMHGAAILTVGVVIMKVLGAIYKIPLGNILGDEGYSMFMGAYSIYNIFFTLATAGLPVALSRLVAEADAHGRMRQEEKTFRVALGTFAVIGVLFSLILFLFPHWLAANYLENPDAAMSIRAMAPAILLVCLVSAYRGYCQGNGNMIPTTVDEVLEVLFKVISGLILAAALLRARYPLPYGSAGAILGVSIGSVVSLGYMIVYKHRHYNDLAAPYTAGVVAPDAQSTEGKTDGVVKIVRDLLTIGVPIALGACIMAILNSVDSKLCMNRLQTAAHYSYFEAKVLYGVYGKAQTFFNLPAAFITPLTISIVPAISGAFARNSREEAAKISEDSMRIAALIALPMGVGLSVLSMPIMTGFFAGSHAAGPGLLAIMGAASFFVCMLLMENAVLQASGKERYTMFTMILGGLVKILVNWVLVARRDINIYGAPIGTLVSYIFMCVLNFIFMSSMLERTPRVGRILSKSVLCSALMGLCAWALFGLGLRFVPIPGRVGLLLAMFIAMAGAVVVYAVSVVATRAITREDLELIPGGGKVAALLHIK